MKPKQLLHSIRLALLPATLLACAATLHAAEVAVSAPDSPMLRFALGKLEAALQQQGDVLKHTAHPAPDPAPGIAVAVDPAALAMQRAVAELEKALAHWKRLAELGARFNQLPVLSNSKAPFSWASLTPAVEKDTELAKAPLTPPTSTR